MLALLQFDSAALPVVERLLGEGRLPSLAALKRRGAWTRLDAHTLLQSAAHPTLYTGIDVREHGLYSAFPWSASDQRAHPVSWFDKPPTIWERLTAHGVRSLVVDPYLSWAPREMAGAWLSGCHFVDRLVLPSRSVPAAAGRRLERRHGRAPRLDDVYGVATLDGLVPLRDALVAAPARVADGVLDLSRESRYEVLWITFGASHKAGHHLWDAAAVGGGAIGEADSRALREGLDDVYVAIDRAVGRLVDALPADADVIAFSPTGMGPNLSRADLLPGMLAAVLGEGAGGRAGARSPIWTLRARVPARWRRGAARLLPDEVAADLVTRMHVRADWPRTRAVALPGENQGYVRLNLRGREREGIVDARDAEALMSRIAEGLTTFRDAGGVPAVARVERMADLAGPAASPGLPDLVVTWSDRPADLASDLASLRFGRVARGGIGSGRSGNHTDDAWAVVVPGRSRPSELRRGAGIADIGATACALAGADRAGLTGEPLLEPA